MGIDMMRMTMMLAKMMMMMKMMIQESGALALPAAANVEVSPRRSTE